MSRWRYSSRSYNARTGPSLNTRIHQVAARDYGYVLPPTTEAAPITHAQRMDILDKAYSLTTPIVTIWLVAVAQRPRAQH